MGIATGRPRGRPKGAKNKRTVEREADMREMAARIGNAVGGAFEATPWHTSHQSIKTRRSPKTCEWQTPPAARSRVDISIRRKLLY
jgi:hypothetical protein